jgi:hypothetical protein
MSFPTRASVWIVALWAALALAARLPAAETGKLTVRVLDAKTGQPMPARLALRASDGTYPGDRLAVSAARWPNMEIHGVFIPGEQTFDLPPGPTLVTAAHGLEYQAERRTVTVEAGKPATLEFTLQRIVNMRKAGWVSGDMHVHMWHGENQRQTSYQDVATTSAGNGLDFVYVGQEYVGAGMLDLAGYEAECRKVSTERFRMLLGAERPKSLLGHQMMIGVRNPFVIAEDPPYHRAARKVHAQGGALVYVHPLRYFPGKQYQGEWLDFPGNNMARELVFDTFLGPAYDGLSVLSDEPANPDAFALWFNLLNRGLRVPVFADSDACFDRTVLDYKAPGFWNTYLYVGPGGAMDHETLSEAVQRGRTIATTGPVLRYSIDGQISGATLPPDGRPHALKIEAWLPQHAFTLETGTAERHGGIGRVELIRNGVVVKTWEPHAAKVEIAETVTESAPCWYVARVYGEDAKWQVGVASPIYFAAQPAPLKREPLPIEVRGRIYDFQTGAERAGTVEIRRDDQVLKSFPARGPFRVKMPLDAEIVVRADGFRPLTKNLLMDDGPIHHFLWYLESKDLARAETFDRFEKLVRTIDLEFPLGYRMPGSYPAAELGEAAELPGVRVLGGPPRRTDGTAAIAAVLMDAEQIQVGDSLHVAVVYRDEGDPSKLGPLVVEARGYDPSRPTAYGELKKFAEFEKRWVTAADLGDGYRLVSGTLKVAEWVKPGPTGGVDLSIRARRGDGDAAFLGLHVPLGPTRRALWLSTAWPTMPVSWPDGHYGIGPFHLCNRVGRAAQPKSDYRQLHLEAMAGGKTLDLLPARDARGCADADDAYYTGQFLDQVLNEQSHVATPDPIRPQPAVVWPATLPLIDATGN